MACSKNFFDDVKKELECSVCQEQFSDLREPKILKCLHTFCKSCLIAWLPRQQREGELSCPTCRRITQCSANDINKLPSNLFCKQLVEIVEAYSGHLGHEDSPHCGICDEKKALKFYCNDCNCFLCGDCAAGLHGKAKAFKGHNIKEISNFNSSDVQKYVRRANVCKKHEDEVRYYCEKCNICICRDCALLEHREHNIISLDDGLDLKKSDITKRIEEVEDVGRRLQEQKTNLEKQKTRFDTSVDQSTLEIHRVAEHWINIIRRHEEAMTKELLKRKESFEMEFCTKMTDVNEKLTDIKNSLEFGRDILERNNLPGILSVEETLGQRFEEFSSTTGFSEPIAMIVPCVNYVANDMLFSESELGKLVDPKTSIEQGKRMTKVRLGDFSFTKNWRGETTYDAADQGDVDITSLRRTDEGKESESPVAGAGQAGPTPNRTKESDFYQWSPSESHAIKVLTFEVMPKILEVLSAAHKKELDDIGTHFRVTVPRVVTEGNQISLKPCDGCSAEDYDKACDAFINLYQKASEVFTAATVSLRSGPRKPDAREAISTMLKEFPEVLFERSKVHKRWEMYGEAGHLQKALS
ncbi:E3 ubiquitin-protein ligase TRIM56-like [Acropora muricata]|uniref:E3 ubiquitin-protein ligase TRIM56-like n=1 Tax=Acropora muricata TaxID=159855 RepID=UPI0034E48CD3